MRFPSMRCSTISVSTGSPIPPRRRPASTGRTPAPAWRACPAGGSNCQWRRRSFHTRYSARQRPGLRRCGPTCSTGMRSTGAVTSPRSGSQSSSPRSCGRPSGHGEARDLAIRGAPNLKRGGATLMRYDSENETGVGAPHVSRRTFMLAAAATGSAGIMSSVSLALMGARPSASSIDHWRSHMEKPIELVRRFCAAWGNNMATAQLAAFFTDDAVYHNIPMAPVIGREAIAKNIGSFIRPGKAAGPGIVPVESIDFRIINIAANGPVVMTERVDVFKLPGKSFELPVMGTFEVKDGKISAWRDYFDMNQFTSRVG